MVLRQGSGAQGPGRAGTKSTPRSTADRNDELGLKAGVLARRGLDVPGHVDHVVNFDFPLNPVDYLHRTGRTARAGAAGRITSLVARRDAVCSSTRCLCFLIRIFGKVHALELI